MELALELGAQRLELANTQYYGWAVPNQAALMPTRAQLEHAEAAVNRFRRASRSAARHPLGAARLLRGAAEALHGRLGARRRSWSRPTATCCPARRRARSRGWRSTTCASSSLDWIWFESDAFTRFRGTDWMQEPCRSCPLGRQEQDFGGCRCQAMRLTGDAAATDPVCRFSPDHHQVLQARDAAPDDEFVYRTMRPIERVR